MQFIKVDREWERYHAYATMLKHSWRHFIRPSKMVVLQQKLAAFSNGLCSIPRLPWLLIMVQRLFTGHFNSQNAGTETSEVGLVLYDRVSSFRDSAHGATTEVYSHRGRKNVERSNVLAF